MLIKTNKTGALTDPPNTSTITGKANEKLQPRMTIPFKQPILNNSMWNISLFGVIILPQDG
jgi:ABC-type iron transport system FetAB permease component